MGPKGRQGETYGLSEKAGYGAWEKLLHQGQCRRAFCNTKRVRVRWVSRQGLNHPGAAMGQHSIGLE
jgi:hypothetical protein